MNELQIFNSNEFGQIRAIEQNGEPWFVAKDVCEILELSNPTMAMQRLDNDEVTKFNLGGLSGDTNVVNEYGLYSLVLGSRKPEAKQFKRWITHDVVPTIRKHGGYLTADKVEEVLSDPDTIIRLCQDLKAERNKRKQAEQTIEENKPKILFADSVTASNKSMLIGELAKIIKQNGYEVGQKRLFQWLRENNYLCKIGESYNLPSQYAMERKLFEIKKSTVNAPNGNVIVTNTVKVTPKGQMYFINKFLGEKRA